VLGSPDPEDTELAGVRQGCQDQFATAQGVRLVAVGTRIAGGGDLGVAMRVKAITLQSGKSGAGRGSGFECAAEARLVSIALG
jgi:hypothetical protein